ncbi:hypothetical protein [Halobacterium zhouii]|uniref:hypothetical protein n=1 Tax=Halobacterium zhouii TaxID=2902624 RepID=UPI001E633FE4|nr:hypothetical protein [Halobacterium zhouii]
MNSSRCSELAVALVVLVLVATVPAAAVSISGDAPSKTKVGEKQRTTFTLTEPFSDYEEWTLKLQTELTDVTWRITTYDNADNQVSEKTLTGQSVEYHLQAKSGVTRVEVRLVGTAPGVNNWSYDPAQQFTYAKFVQAQQGGSSDTVKRLTTRPYTTESQNARTAITSAKRTIDDVEDAADVSGAKSDLQDAIEFYNSGNFQQAIQNANQAEEAAKAAASSAQQMDTLLMVGAGIVVLLVVLGGVYWYLQQRETYDKLG